MKLEVLLFDLVDINEVDKNIIIKEIKEGTYKEKTDRFMVTCTGIDKDFYETSRKNESEALKDVLSKKVLINY